MIAAVTVTIHALELVAFCLALLVYLLVAIWRRI